MIWITRNVTDNVGEDKGSWNNAGIINQLYEWLVQGIIVKI